MGIAIDDFVARYPRLYHMAELGSWDSIREHGLLSTSALLDLYQVEGEARFALESQQRPESVEIERDGLGKAVVRDQKPMTDKGLVKALRDDLTPRRWYEILNERVFFWVEEQRLERLLGARAYRSRRHTVLTVATGEMLAHHAARALLAPINTGNTFPNPQPRGLDTFLPLDQYPFEHWVKKRRGKEPVVELAVLHSVPNIREFVLRVENRGCGKPMETIWTRED